jgi:hypothetical protein
MHLFNSRSEQLAALTLRHRVPAIYQYREFVSAGGLPLWTRTVHSTFTQAEFSRARSRPICQSNGPQRSS